MGTRVFQLCVLSVIAAACLLASQTVYADNCSVNTVTYTFDHIEGGIFGSLLENGTSDCINIAIKNDSAPTQYTMQLLFNGTLGASITITNSSVANVNYMNICLFAEGNPGESGVCTPSSNVINEVVAPGPTNSLFLTPLMLDTSNPQTYPPGELWGVNLNGYGPGPGFYGESATFQIDLGVGTNPAALPNGLIAIPEPGSLVLLGGGFLTIMGAIRRKMSS